jgi:hypothetical protein
VTRETWPSTSKETEPTGIAARNLARGEVALRLERTRAERVTATVARRRVGIWCVAALDDDKLDIPGLPPPKPLAATTGTGVVLDIHPLTVLIGFCYSGIRSRLPGTPFSKISFMATVFQTRPKSDSGFIRPE